MNFIPSKLRYEILTMLFVVFHVHYTSVLGINLDISRLHKFPIPFKKIPAKSKKRKSREDEKFMRQGSRKEIEKYKEQMSGEQIEYRTVLFVENSEGGELASRFREHSKRLAPTLGFGCNVIRPIV